MKRPVLCRLGFHYWLSTTQPTWYACRWCGRWEQAKED